MLYIGIALFNTENEILKADPNNLGESNKKIQRMRHRNEVLEKFYVGKTDEKFVQDYYEILKKADVFIRNATPFKVAVTADKYGMNLGKADKYGRLHDHFGFYDTKSKNEGKTINVVLQEEMDNRGTTDDDYQLLHIFNNKPIDSGLMGVPTDVYKDIDSRDFKFSIDDLIEQSKKVEFPMQVYRQDNEILNKIEKITDYLHVKKIGFDFVLLEFFVPLKFKTNSIEEDSKIFKELIDFDQVFFKDKYGELIGFKVNNFVKRIEYNKTHDVFKFNGNTMEIIR